MSDAFPPSQPRHQAEAGSAAQEAMKETTRSGLPPQLSECGTSEMEVEFSVLGTRSMDRKCPQELEETPTQENVSLRELGLTETSENPLRTQGS